MDLTLASQSEVVCICTLSDFYHMAKQHSKGASTQTTDKTTVHQENLESPPHPFSARFAHIPLLTLTTFYK